MRKLFTGFAAAMLAVVFVAPGTFSSGAANAAPVFIPKTPTTRTDVIQVRDGWYRGYRGYRYYRSGYRNLNGWWYPAGAFVAGAIIGGAIANSNNYYYDDDYYDRRYYDDRYYVPRYNTRRYYAPSRVYYPPRGTAYRQGYRDGFRDGVNARRYNRITCNWKQQDAGRC